MASPAAEPRVLTLRRVVVTALFAAAVIGGALLGVFLAFESDLPQVTSLEDFQPNIITQVLASDDSVIGEFAIEKRVVVAFRDIPPVLGNPIVAVEDEDFWKHLGINPWSVPRAALANLRSGRRGQGFSTLTMPFVNMVNRFGQELQPNQALFTQLLDEHFMPGSFDEGGQDWLRESMNAYYQARFATANKASAELILLGNILLALHEQSRLQPVIEKAVAVPFDVFMEGLIPETDKEARGLRKKLANRTAGISREMVQRYVTRMWMSYTLPHREMKVGRNVVAPTGLINFPQDLINIEDVRCREMIQKFDVGMETLSGSAAGNWGH